MSDEKYYTADTGSVASEIDVSAVTTGSNPSDDSWRFKWKRPLSYLLLLLLAFLAAMLAGLWLGIEISFVP